MKACTTCLVASSVMYFRMSPIRFICWKHERLISFIVFFKVHVLIKHYSQISALVLDGTLSFPMWMCMVVIVLRKYGGAISRNSVFPSFSCNLFINIHILMSAMHDWTSFMAISSLILSEWYPKGNVNLCIICIHILVDESPGCIYGQCQQWAVYIL